MGQTQTRTNHRSAGKVTASTASRDATPHGLVLLLFDGVRLAVNDARAQMQFNQIAAKGVAIGKAVEIIDCGLKSSLDLERGGKIAEQLYSLYEYMVQRLTLANLRNEPAHLNEVGQLLAEIEGAWRQIAPPVAAPQTSAESRVPAGGSYAKA
jgi:flagellar protein FliS